MVTILSPPRFNWDFKLDPDLASLNLSLHSLVLDLA